MKLTNILMKRAVQLAVLAGSPTRTNPKVASIVYDDKGNILGEGYHRAFGSHHAEVNAINALKKDSSAPEIAANLIVTLEPCNHKGKTPPCVDLILNNNFIRKIYIGNVDPNPLMSGNSIKILQDSGLVIERSDLEILSENLLKTFKVNIRKKRPYIYLKIAMDKTGTIGDHSRRLYVTDAVSQFYTHKLRSEVNAILIGNNTALIDDPELSNRLAGGDSPMRVVIDLSAKLPVGLKLFNDEMPTLYFTRFSRTDLSGSTEIFKTELAEEALLLQILDYLYNVKNVGSILVEGGADTIGRFIEYNLWDELAVFRSNDVLETDSPVKFAIPPSRLISEINLKADNLYFYRPLDKC